MPVEGLWTSEIMGLFGWEPVGVLVLESGRVLGGGTHHYSIGSYRAADSKLELDVAVEYYGTPRTMFGASDRNLRIQARLEMNGSVMEGRAHRMDNPDQTVVYRLTRRADIPHP